MTTTRTPFLFAAALVGALGGIAITQEPGKLPTPGVFRNA
jgi:hypothetical protein